MKQRCENPSDARYEDYGGRGIAVCPSWQSFAEFYSDMGEPPNGFVLDRLDNEKGYCRENCKWVTAKVSCNNRRSSIRYFMDEKWYSIAELAELSGVNYRTIQTRLRAGTPVKEALSASLYSRTSKGLPAMHRKLYELTEGVLK
jgi:hypothetical protein